MSTEYLVPESELRFCVIVGMTRKGCAIKPFVCLPTLLTCRRHKSRGNISFCSMSPSGRTSETFPYARSAQLVCCSRAGGKACGAGAEEAETC